MPTFSTLSLRIICQRTRSQAGKHATAAASKRAAATAAKAQAIAKGASDAAKNAETVDMLETLGGMIPNGVGDLAELTVDSIVCAGNARI